MNRSAHDPGSQQPTPGPGAAGVVTGDLVCLQCGYNLRTLSHAGRCPECGRPVWDSVTIADLRYAPAPHLERLATAASILLSCCIVGMLTMIVGALLIAVVIVIPAYEPVLSAIPPAAVLLLALAVMAMWVLATPDPRGKRLRLRHTGRAAPRRALLGAVLSLPAALVAAGFGRWALAFATVCICLVSLLVLPALLAQHLAALQRQLGVPAAAAPGRAAAMSYVLGLMVALFFVMACFSPGYAIPGGLLAALGLHEWRLALGPLVADLWAAAKCARRRDAPGWRPPTPM